MKKFVSIIALITCTLALVFSSLSTPEVSAAVADGTYSVNYQVLKADNNSASIADGYFSKPASVTVENGKQYVQMTITSSDMVQSLTGPYGKASVVSENKGNNTKVVKFQVADITKPVSVKMHVVVDAGEVQYDTEHGARFVFDSISSSSGGSKAAASSGGNNDSQTQTANNPKTGDETPILLFSVLLIGSGLLLARRFAIK